MSEFFRLESYGKGEGVLLGLWVGLIDTKSYQALASWPTRFSDHSFPHPQHLISPSSILFSSTTFALQPLNDEAAPSPHYYYYYQAMLL